METLVQLIFIIAIAKYSLNAALSGSLWMVVGYAFAAASFALVIYPFVIEQPLTIISDMLNDKVMVENMALITTIEAIAGVFISLYLIDNYFKPKAKRTKLAFVFKIIPGILVLFAIGYLELLFFKFSVGKDFVVTAVLYASLLFATILASSLLVKFAIKGESLKLEVKVVFNLTILVAGLLISSSVADYNRSHAQAKIEWSALISLIVVALSLAALGLWLQKIDLKKLLKKQ